MNYSTRITVKDVAKETEDLRGGLVTAGLLPAEATLQSINQGAGWHLWSSHELPCWLNCSLGRTTADAFTTLRSDQQMLWAFNDGMQRALQLVNGAAYETWKTLVLTDGMEGVPCIDTANALCT